MNVRFRHYTEQDFDLVRSFLVDTYPVLPDGFNWTIERWNFAYSLDRMMNGVSVNEWQERTGIWEDDNGVVAIVTSEGEGTEAFFQVGSVALDAGILEEMFAFSEERIRQLDRDTSSCSVWIPEGDHRREACALKRGYRRQEHQDRDTWKHLEEEPASVIPKGFTLATGDQVSDGQKGVGHARAFGYEDSEVYAKRSPQGYAAMRQTPDYRADLDLYLVDDTGEVASFCTIWLDSRNRIGMLEPVGTVPKYRRLGLGKAVIGQGLHRVAAEGATRAAGGDQPFYEALGFRVTSTRSLWTKHSLER